MKLGDIQALQHTAQVVKPYDPSTMPSPLQEPATTSPFTPVVGVVAAVLIVSFLSYHFLRKRSRRRYRH